MSDGVYSGSNPIAPAQYHQAHVQPLQGGCSYKDEQTVEGCRSIPCMHFLMRHRESLRWHSPAVRCHYKIWPHARGPNSRRSGMVRTAGAADAVRRYEDSDLPPKTAHLLGYPFAGRQRVGPRTSQYARALPRPTHTRWSGFLCGRFIAGLTPQGLDCRNCSTF